MDIVTFLTFVFTFYLPVRAVEPNTLGMIYAAIQIVILVCLTFVVDRVRRRMLMIPFCAMAVVALAATAAVLFLKPAGDEKMNVLGAALLIPSLTFINLGIGPVA
jgi:hypothetical protein